jgi:large subunit ribosomal protein L33
MATGAKTSKKKRARVLFRLVSTAINEKTGKLTGFFYLFRRNPKKKKEKGKFRRYDPVVKKHVLFVEKKDS